MYILFDIGKSKMRFAASRDCQEFCGEPVVFKTPETFEEAMHMVTSTAADLCEGESIEMIGGGVGGPLDKSNSILLNFPHKPDWAGRPIKSELERIFHAPVVLENDSAVVGLGEACFGAGKGHDIVVYMTVSTGVGGARIVNGRIGLSAAGYEPGHQFIDFDMSACEACSSGKLEDYVSGTATEKRFGKPPYEINDDAEWDKIARWLSFGLANTIVHWSPDIVVLGGSMVVGRPGISVSDVQKHLKETLTIFPQENHPAIVEAKCGDYGGLWGAMALLEQRRNKNEQ